MYRSARAGEHVVTRLASGSEETENIAEESDVIITNPGGEKQIVSLEKAVMRYDPSDTPGLFTAKGMVRVVDNPFNQPISLTAPWGAPQHGDARCKIVAIYDPDNPDDISTDRYIVAEQEFIDTYGTEPFDPTAAERPAPHISEHVLKALEDDIYATEDRRRMGLGATGIQLVTLFT